MLDFLNRSQELALIKRNLPKGGFGYVTGRRRVGKTATLREACKRFGGLYHQAVEGTAEQQLLHLVEEIKSALPIFRDVTPKSWTEFFGLLSREKLPKLLVFDEFPYWVEGDPGLPSILQKWIDHELPRTKTLLLVSGSSLAMLHSQFLNPSAPLYGRASLHLGLQPMSYRWFSQALHCNIDNPNSFVGFSLVGGVPHYWRLMPKGSAVKQAQALYFEPGAILAEEPTHLLRDEKIAGTLPKALLDLIGRGVRKPSELAARLATAQGNLSRPLALLLNLNLIQRDLPFGESSRTTKKVLYTINDPAISFYYGSYLPNRGTWQTLNVDQKLTLLNSHASRCWEHFCRQVHPGSSRYWEGNIEIDLVCKKKGENSYLVAECKWMDLTPSEEKALFEKLQKKFSQTRLSHKIKTTVEFRMFSKKDLALLAHQEESKP